MKRTLFVFLSLLSLLQIANGESQRLPGILDSIPALTHWVAADQGRTTEAEAYLKSSGRDSSVLSEYGFVKVLEQDFAGQEGSHISSAPHVLPDTSRSCAVAEGEPCEE